MLAWKSFVLTINESVLHPIVYLRLASFRRQVTLVHGDPEVTTWPIDCVSTKKGFEQRVEEELIIAHHITLIIKFQTMNLVAMNAKFNVLTSSAGNYMFKVNNRKNTRTRCEICSKLIIKTPERRQWRRSGVLIVNFEHILHLVLMFLLLTSSR